jgi:Icc-related predicted phosphoesterase
MIRIAAAGDVHYDRNSAGKLGEHLGRLRDLADIFLLAGDLTQTGHVEEAQTLARDLKLSPVPVVAVFGNHDLHMGQEREFQDIMEDAGVYMLERNTAVFEIGGTTVGIAGTKGFGGGYMGACGSDFGEPEMKAFIRHTKNLSKELCRNLSDLDTEYKIALLHYSPVVDTLLGEKKEIYPFLGSYLLAQAIDEGGADIAFHGHAHRGIEKGLTPGGVPVRNVAQTVIRHAFNVYTIGKEGLHQPAETPDRDLRL